MTESKFPELRTENKIGEQSVGNFLCQYIIPDSKSESLVSYIATLRKKFPSMKSDRLLKKAAEYFHLKRIELNSVN